MRERTERRGTITLQTKRLVLRRVRLEDAALLRQEMSRPSISRYTGWNPYVTAENAREKIRQDQREDRERRGYCWIIEAEGHPVGSIGAYGYEEADDSIELGATIFQAFQGRGYASEAMSEVVRYLFEDEELSRVHAWCHEQNIASARAQERAGLVAEGRQENAMTNPDGTRSALLLYGVSRKDWLAAHRR